MDAWWTTVGLFLIFQAGIVLYATRRKKLPPGPPGLPFLGNILALKRDKKTFILLDKWSKIYGDVFSLQIGSMNAVVLSSFGAVKEALLEKPAHFADRPHSLTGDITSEGGEDITFSDTGPVWKLHRKIVNTCLRSFITSEKLEELVRDQTSDLLQLISQENSAFDPSRYLKLGIFNIVCGMCFNKRYSFEDNEFKELENIAEKFVEIVGRGLPEDFFPFLRYFPSKSADDFRSVINTFLDILRKHWDQHKATYVKGEPRDIMDIVLAMQNEARNKEDIEILESLSDKRVIQTIFNILEGGIDTIVLQMYWLVLHLTLNQHAQDKVYKEINVLSTDPPRGSHRRCMPYTEAVISESLRLGSVAALGLPHKATRDSTQGGFEIPKDTAIIINHWSLHRDPRHWENPEEFVPERFLDEDGHFLQKPPGYLPFSTGRRSCVGEPMVRLTVFLQLVILLQTFQLLPPPGGCLTLEPADSGIVSMPKPYQIVVKSRK